MAKPGNVIEELFFGERNIEGSSGDSRPGWRVRVRIARGTV